MQRFFTGFTVLLVGTFLVIPSSVRAASLSEEKTLLAIDRGGVDLETAERIRKRNVRRSNLRRSSNSQRSSEMIRQLKKHLETKRNKPRDFLETPAFAEKLKEAEEKTLTINRGGLTRDEVRSRRPGYSLRTRFGPVKKNTQEQGLKIRRNRTRPGAASRQYLKKDSSVEAADERRIGRRTTGSRFYGYKQSKRRNRSEEKKDLKEAKYRRPTYRDRR